jgi:hypothetical protein
MDQSVVAIVAFVGFVVFAIGRIAYNDFLSAEARLKRALARRQSRSMPTR